MTRKRRISSTNLDGKRDNFESHHSGARELCLVLVVSDDNSNVVKQIMLGLLLLWCGRYESHWVPPGNIAQLVIAHGNGQTIEVPVNSEFLVNHVLEHVDLAFLMVFAAKNNACLILFHAKLLKNKLKQTHRILVFSKRTS